MGVMEIFSKRNLMIFATVFVATYVLLFCLMLPFDGEESKSNILAAIITLFAAFVASVTVFLNYEMQKKDKENDEKKEIWRKCLSTALIIKADISSLVLRVREVGWEDYFKSWKDNLESSVEEYHFSELPISNQDYFIIFHSIIDRFDDIHLYLSEVRSHSNVSADAIIKWYISAKGFLDTLDGSNNKNHTRFAALEGYKYLEKEVCRLLIDGDNLCAQLIILIEELENTLSNKK